MAPIKPMHVIEEIVRKKGSEGVSGAFGADDCGNPTATPGPASPQDKLAQVDLMAAVKAAISPALA